MAITGPVGWNATRDTLLGRTPHSRGGLPIGPSFVWKGQTTQASAPDVASHCPSLEKEKERVLPG